MYFKSARFPSILRMTVVLSLMLLCGADAPSREYKVKAAFIYNFAQFVQWPDSSFVSSDAPITIGVIGSDPFNGALEQAVAGKRVGDRAVQIQHFDSLYQIAACHILFVSATDDETLGKITEKVRHQPVLTIGENESFPWAGGCIRFFTEDNKMRFEINLEAADTAKLKISSKLIRLGKIFKK